MDTRQAGALLAHDPILNKLLDLASSGKVDHEIMLKGLVVAFLLGRVFNEREHQDTCLRN